MLKHSSHTAFLTAVAALLSTLAAGSYAQAQPAPAPVEEAPADEAPVEEASAEEAPAEEAPAEEAPAEEAPAEEAPAEEAPAEEAPANESEATSDEPTEEAPEAALAPASEERSALESADVGDIDLMGLLEIDVSTATKTSESLDEAPAIITAITADEIQRWGYQSVGEVLQHVMGFYLVDDHITPNAAVRGVSGGLGAESSVIKVMIDGRSVAFRTTSGNWLGVELVPLSSIKQIEIIRGPASALYGADAFLGVVNIITIDPTDVRHVDMRVTGGVSGDQPAGSFDITSGAWGERFDVMLTAAGEMKDRSGLAMPPESPAPRVPSYNDPYGEAQDLKRNSLVVGGRVGYVDPEHGHRLSVSSYASGARRGGDFAHWAQLTAGTDDQGRDVGSVVSLGQFRVNADGLYQATEKFALASQATYFQGGLLPPDRIEVGSDLFYVERKMSYRGVDFNAEGRYVPNKKFNLIVGSEVVFDNETLPSPLRISKDDGSVLSGEATGETVDLFNIGAYASANLQVVDRWLKLTGGARYDYHNLYGSQVSGRFGITSRLSDGLVAKALYGSAFKAPTPYLLFAEPLIPGDVIGNEDLKPQYVHTWEGQLSYKAGSFLKASTGVSYSLLLDKAEFIPQGINLAAQNAATQTALTWENRIDLRHLDLLGGYTSFELARSYRESDLEGYQADLVGTEMIVYPQWTLRAGAFVALPSPPKVPLELSTQAIVAGPRRAADASILENGGSFELEPYVLWNASLRTRAMKLLPRQETFIALRAKNLLGSRGPDPGFSGFEYPLAPREIMVELTHRY